MLKYKDKLSIDSHSNSSKIVEFAILVDSSIKIDIDLNCLYKYVVIEIGQTKIYRKLNDMFYCKTF